MRLAYCLAMGGSLVLGACFDHTGTINDSGPGSSSGTDGTATDPPVTTGNSTSDPPPSTDASSTADPPETDDTVDPDDTTTPPECEGAGLDPACPDESPYCVDGNCDDCEALGESGCGELDPAAPVCDEVAGTCTACTEHDQCDTGACRVATGECFAASNRLWVDNTFGGCAGGTGTEKSPFCEVVDAISVLNGQAGEEPWAVFVAGSPNEYLGTIDVGNNRPVAIIGPEMGLAATLQGDGGYTIDQWAQSPETYLARLTIESGNFGPAMRCNTGDVYVSDSNFTSGETAATVTGCTLRLLRTTVSVGGMNLQVGPGGTLLADQSIIENSSGGIYLEGTAVLDRSIVRDHYVEGGININGGDLTLVNSMVYYNQHANDGIRVANGGSFDINHSTIVGAVTCPGMTRRTVIRNSIVLGQSFEAGMDCGTATVNTSVLNAGLGQGNGNVMASEMDLASIFVNPGTGMGADWHVLPGSIPEGVAVRQAGDPIIDIDGDPRPMMAGANDWAGADVP